MKVDLAKRLAKLVKDTGVTTIDTDANLVYISKKENDEIFTDVYHSDDVKIGRELHRFNYGGTVDRQKVLELALATA
jgi:hypothetical protein